MNRGEKSVFTEMKITRTGKKGGKKIDEGRNEETGWENGKKKEKLSSLSIKVVDLVEN